MYFGSVKFFKDLILTVALGWIVTATGLALFFGVRYYQLKADAPGEGAAAAITDVLVIPESASLEEIYDAMLDKGFSPEEIFQYVRENASAGPGGTQGVLTQDPKAEEPAQTASLYEESLPGYASLYPELYSDSPPAEFVVTPHTAYLTFDDGPSENTLMILDILRRYDIKATFFFSGGEDEEARKIMKRAADEGHTIGVHSISHKYEYVYASVENFLEDFYNTYMSVYDATGVKPQLYRFPGGSINNYNRQIYQQLIAEVTRRGFVYHDWNVTGDDASKNATWTTIYNSVLNGIRESGSDRAVILLHDSKERYSTVLTVNDIIDALLADGYAFAPLDNTVRPFIFTYVD